MAPRLAGRVWPTIGRLVLQLTVRAPLQSAAPSRLFCAKWRRGGGARLQAPSPQAKPCYFEGGCVVGTTNPERHSQFQTLRCAAQRVETGEIEGQECFETNLPSILTCWISVNSILSAAIGSMRRAGAQQDSP